VTAVSDVRHPDDRLETLLPAEPRGLRRGAEDPELVPHLLERDPALVPEGDRRRHRVRHRVGGDVELFGERADDRRQRHHALTGGARAKRRVLHPGFREADVAEVVEERLVGAAELARALPPLQR